MKPGLLLFSKKQRIGERGSPLKFFLFGYEEHLPGQKERNLHQAGAEKWKKKPGATPGGYFAPRKRRTCGQQEKKNARRKVPQLRRGTIAIPKTEKKKFRGSFVGGGGRPAIKDVPV